MEGSATEVKPTLADHLARIPAIKSLNAVEDGAVELLKHASRTMVCLSSVNSNELKQQELEEHCTNYMNLLKVRPMYALDITFVKIETTTEARTHTIQLFYTLSISSYVCLYCLLLPYLLPPASDRRFATTLSSPRPLLP